MYPGLNKVVFDSLGLVELAEIFCYCTVTDLRLLYRVIIYGIEHGSVMFRMLFLHLAFTLSPLKLITCNKQ